MNISIARFAVGVVLGLALVPQPSATKTKATAQNIEASDCKQTSGSDNLMSARIFIIRDKATNGIEVIDGLIKYVDKKPIAAEVQSDTSVRLDLKWIVTNIPLARSGAGGRAIFHLTYLKGSRTYTESVVLSGFDNNEISNGTCVPVQ